MPSVKINFDSKIHANAFAIYLESQGLEDFMQSQQYKTITEKMHQQELDASVNVNFDNHFSNHEVNTYYE